MNLQLLFDYFFLIHSTICVLTFMSVLNDISEDCLFYLKDLIVLMSSEVLIPFGLRLTMNENMSVKKCGCSMFLLGFLFSLYVIYNPIIDILISLNIDLNFQVIAGVSCNILIFLTFTSVVSYFTYLFESLHKGLLNEELEFMEETFWKAFNVKSSKLR